MKIADLLDILEDESSDRKLTLEAKASDYASKEDVLSNFKNVGKLEGRPQHKVILSLINTKVGRLNNLLGSDLFPANEPVDDTILDLQNYLLLLKASLLELEGEKATKIPLTHSNDLVYPSQGNTGDYIENPFHH